MIKTFSEGIVGAKVSNTIQTIIIPIVALGFIVGLTEGAMRYYQVGIDTIGLTQKYIIFGAIILICAGAFLSRIRTDYRLYKLSLIHAHLEVKRTKEHFREVRNIENDNQLSGSEKSQQLKAAEQEFQENIAQINTLAKQCGLDSSNELKDATHRSYACVNRAYFVWVLILAIWFLFYLLLIFFSYKKGVVAASFESFIFNTFNNLSTLGFIAFATILSEDSYSTIGRFTNPNSKNNAPGKFSWPESSRWAFYGFVGVFILDGLLRLVFPVSEYPEFCKIIDATLGLAFAFAASISLSLLAGRLDSKFIQKSSTNFYIVSIYLYASLNMMHAFISIVDHTSLENGTIAGISNQLFLQYTYSTLFILIFACKAWLILFVRKLFSEGRLFLYFIRMAKLSDGLDEDAAKVFERINRDIEEDLDRILIQLESDSATEEFSM